MDVEGVFFVLCPRNAVEPGGGCYRMKVCGGSCFFILWLEDIFGGLPAGGLLQEGEEDGEDKAEEGGEMVPVEGFTLEDEGDDQGKDCQGNGLLDHLELHQVEGAAVAGVADAVGRDGETVLEECYAP